jgi:hypothetical protein
MSDDPFETLGLPPRFDLDPTTIERAWLEKMATAHPDIAGSAGSDTASRINRAKGCIENAESRANVLLQHLGGPSAEDNNALPDGFLMDIFAVREDMEQRLAQDGDEARQQLREWASARRAEHEAVVRELFATKGIHSVLTRIREQLNVWRYTERMIEQLDPSYHPTRSE